MYKLLILWYNIYNTISSISFVHKKFEEKRLFIMKNFIVGLSKVALFLLVIFFGFKLIPAIIKLLFNLVVGFFSLPTFWAIVIIVVILLVAAVVKILF